MMFRSTGRGSGDLSAIGPLKRARYKTVHPCPFYLRVRLHPGRARQVFGVPLCELVDQIVPVEALWNSLGRTLTARLIESSPERAVPMVEEALRKFIASRRDEPAPLVSHIVRTIDVNVSTRVVDYARQAGVSARQLRHLFRLELGMSPKHYSRIARLRRLLAVAHGNVAWSDLAADAGFYDQAHMIADFKDLLNSTPRAFLAGGSSRSSFLEAPEAKQDL
jgi:AraC-like DNA-binding protein